MQYWILMPEKRWCTNHQACHGAVFDDLGGYEGVAEEGPEHGCDDAGLDGGEDDDSGRVLHEVRAECDDLEGEREGVKN